MWYLIKEYIIKNKGELCILILVHLISIFLNMITPYLNGIFINLLIAKITKIQLINYAIFIICIGIVGTFITYIFNILNIKLKNNISFELNLKILKRLQKIVITKYEEFNPTYLNQRINEDSSLIVSFFFDDFLVIIFNSFQLIMLVVIIVEIDKLVFFIVMAFIPIYILIYCFLKKPLFFKGLKLKESQNTFFDKLNEQFLLNREIKVHSNFKYSENTIKKYYLFFFKNFFDYFKIVFMFDLLDGVISIIFNAIILIVGGLQVLNGNLTIGGYSMITIYFSMLLSLTKYYFNVGKKYQDVNVSVKRNLEFINIPLEHKGEFIIKGIEFIKLKELNLKKDSNLPYTNFNRFSYYFERGKLYSIIGNNGRGKSTLLNILIGILEEGVEGEILYNGINIKDIDLYKVRKNNISIMLQNERNETIKVHELLEVNLNDKSIEGIMKNIKEKKLDFIYNNENFNIKKYMLLNLNELSGGERQMILFLRTILKEADVYILDEPTSNIDIDLIDNIIEYLNMLKKEKIVMIVTHNEKLIYRSDEIINLDNI